MGEGGAHRPGGEGVPAVAPHLSGTPNPSCPSQNLESRSPRCSELGLGDLLSTVSSPTWVSFPNNPFVPRTNLAPTSGLVSTGRAVDRGGGRCREREIQPRSWPLAPRRGPGRGCEPCRRRAAGSAWGRGWPRGAASPTPDPAARARHPRASRAHLLTAAAAASGRDGHVGSSARPSHETHPGRRTQSPRQHLGLPETKSRPGDKRDPPARTGTGWGALWTPCPPTLETEQLAKAGASSGSLSSLGLEPPPRRGHDGQTAGGHCPPLALRGLRLPADPSEPPPRACLRVMVPQQSQQGGD